MANTRSKLFGKKKKQKRRIFLYNKRLGIEMGWLIEFFQEANSRLRRELSQHGEISRLMIDSKDLDNVTHTELVQKFGEIN